VDVQLFVEKNDRAGIEAAKSKVILQNIRVFAVDQTVQRSPDGSEERTIAKTVSLLLTPDQASKLTLAENLGEISLIPRNPDDEDVAVAPEYSPDEIFADGEKGNREKEQVRDDTETTPDSSALLSAVSAVPPKPNFLMEIVEAQEVRTMEFDPDTGKPIREPDAGLSAGPTVPKSTIDDTLSGGLDDAKSAGDAETQLDDFPIEFDPNK
jgi:Flp pilus assembly protein CpaB